MKHHIRGIDDAPFVKYTDDEVPVVAVMMEGATHVDGVALNRMKIDDPEATRFVIEWIKSMKWTASLQGIIFGGVTIAGLGLIQLPVFFRELNIPVITVTRHDTKESTLETALEAAGLSRLIPILNGNPPAVEIQEGIYASFVGVTEKEVVKLIRSTLQKSTMPEPLRIAHLVGAALVNGESKGRV